MIRLRRCLATTAVVLLSAAGTAWSQPDVNEAALRQYAAANGLLNRGLHELAGGEYRSFLATYPEHPKRDIARYGLGVCLYKLEQYREAIETLEPLAGDESFAFAPEVIAIIGQAKLELGDFTGAAATLKRLPTQFGDHHLADDAAALRAEALYYAGSYDAVQSAAESLVAIDPRSPLRERAELFAGMALMAKRQYKPATAWFEAMIDRFPDGHYRARTQLMLAQCLHETDVLRQAAELYLAVIQGAEESCLPEAMYGLAALLQQQGQPEPALELVDTLLKKYPKHELKPDAQLVRGRAALDLGMYDEAESSLQAVLETKKARHDAASYWLAKCDLRQGRATDAVTRLTASIEAYPKSALRAEMMYDLGVAHQRTGASEDAIEAWSRFRTAHPDHALAPEALRLMASTSHELGEYDESLRHCRAFAEQYGDDDRLPAVLFLTAENEYLSGRYDASIGVYEDYLTAYADAPDALKAKYRLGMALTRLDRPAEAQPWLEVATDGARTSEAFRPALLALGDIHFQAGRWAEAAEQLGAYDRAASDLPARDEARLKLGIALLRLDRPDEAADVLASLLAEFPESPHRAHAMFERGQALLASGDDAAAEAVLRALVDTDPDSRFAPYAWNHLGAIATRRGDHAAAADAYARVATDEAGEGLASEATLQRGLSLMAAEQYEEAAAALAAFVDAQPDHPDAGEVKLRLGVALARAGEGEAAVAALESASPEDWDQAPEDLRSAARYELAWRYRDLGRTGDASATYVRLIDDAPDGVIRRHATLELAELRSSAGEQAEAAELLASLVSGVSNEALADDPFWADALYRLGAARYALGDHAGCASALSRMLDGCPDASHRVDASLLCGEALYREGRNERAANRLQAVVDGSDDAAMYGPALLRLGECYAALQYWVKSGEAFEAHRERLPDAPLWFQAQFGYAWAIENQGRHEDAIGAYGPVAEQHAGPTAARAQFQIGECLYALGRHEEAVAEFLKVDILHAYPEWSAAALYEAGRCFEALRDPTQAKKQFREVVGRFEDSDWARLASQRLEELTDIDLPGRG
jgi:TolA-binding protein